MVFKKGVCVLECGCLRLKSSDLIFSTIIFSTKSNFDPKTTGLRVKALYVISFAELRSKSFSEQTPFFNKIMFMLNFIPHGSINSIKSSFFLSLKDNFLGVCFILDESKIGLIAFSSSNERVDGLPIKSISLNRMFNSSSFLGLLNNSFWKYTHG
eukprot:NODE_63_length_26141_cov_1.022656.p22 type:complete len:155 gc:universal NODE_63_length_26141_cov_1.022656:13007-13471(+)